MNRYRNAHWIELNDAKDQYTRMMLPVIPDIKLKCPIQVVFKYWLKNKSQDLNNIHSVITKFFFDALVKKWCIPDDSIQFINATCEEYVKIDKDNPRCEIYIQESLI